MEPAAGDERLIVETAEPAAATASPPAVNVAESFGAGRATIVLLCVTAAQIVNGIMITLLAVVVALASGRRLTDASELRRLITIISGPMVILSAVIAGALTYAFARLWLIPRLDDPEAARVGIAPASRRSVVYAALAGLALAVTLLYVATDLLPPRTRGGPLSQIFAMGGFARMAVVFVAVLLAPPVEELLFRGILLRGFSRSWGIAAGSTVVTVIFVASHVLDIKDYWPGAVAIALLAIFALAARLTTGSLGPAVAVHCSYNLIVVSWSLAVQSS